jgi:hypothetical protein
MDLQISFESNRNGLIATLNNRRFILVYPNDFWETFPAEAKGALVDNIAHLLTINMPLIAGANKVRYNTAPPIFKPFFNTVVEKSIPHSVEDYDVSTQQTLKQFAEIEYEFSGKPEKKFSFNKKLEFYERSVNPLSFGKDSLTSTAVCAEIGLDPIAIYINDTVSPNENELKLARVNKFTKEFGIKMDVVRNELERLNDFELWHKDETMLGYTHMVTGFCLIALPFVHKVGAKYIVLGNQQDMNFGFKNKDGFQTYPSYDQTSEWMIQQDMMVRGATEDQAGVMSVIEPITNIALTKILHVRYKDFGKYQVSCDSLDASDEERWCHDCNKCARNVLFMKAFDIDPSHVGLRNLLLDRKNKRLFSLFKGGEMDCYEKSGEARDQQLLGFLLAYKNRSHGKLIDLFKRDFLEEAKEREEELRKTFFRIYKSKTMPKNIERSVASIYKEELSDFV